MKKNGLLSVVVLVGASACASGPTTGDDEDRRYRRETARIEAQEEFEKLKQNCSRSRGVVVVNRTFSRRISKTPDDLPLATCQRGTPGAMH